MRTEDLADERAHELALRGAERLELPLALRRAVLRVGHLRAERLEVRLQLHADVLRVARAILRRLQLLLQRHHLHLARVQLAAQAVHLRALLLRVHVLRATERKRIVTR